MGIWNESYEEFPELIGGAVLTHDSFNQACDKPLFESLIAQASESSVYL